MDTFVADGKTVSVYPAAEPGAPVVYLNTFGEEGQAVFDALTAIGGPALTLVTISGLDWDRDMSPWDSPAVFKSAAPFAGGADDYLRLLAEEIVPPRNGGCLAHLSGAASRGIPWPGCSRCMLSIARMCSPGRPACPARSGFPGSGSMYFPTRPCASRTVSFSRWATGRARHGIRCSGQYRKIPKPSANFAGARASALSFS